jgi:hypothetical protein
MAVTSIAALAIGLFIVGQCGTQLMFLRVDGPRHRAGATGGDPHSDLEPIDAEVEEDFKRIKNKNQDIVSDDHAIVILCPP